MRERERERPYMSPAVDMVPDGGGGRLCGVVVREGK